MLSTRDIKDFKRISSRCNRAILTQSQTNKTKVLKTKAAQCIQSAILKLQKPKEENPNMYKMIGNSCNEITSSLPCWIKDQCISA